MEQATKSFPGQCIPHDALSSYYEDTDSHTPSATVPDQHMVNSFEETGMHE